MSTTIRDVAKVAGVSPSTVSKVLNKSPLISRETTAHVQSIMQELNYIPNMRARNFAKKQTNSILFLTLSEPHMALMNPYIFEIFCGVEQAVHGKNYTLNYVSAGSISEAYTIIQQAIHEKSADGIVLHGYAVSYDISILLTSSQFPHILIGKPSFETSVCWVDVNNILAGELAARYLYDCGLKRLAFIGGLKNDRISQMRLHGFKQFMAQQRLPVPNDFIKFGIAAIAEGYLLAKELLSSKEIPEGIICENSLTAAGMVKAAKETTLRIPDDISFICFDNYPFSCMIDPLPTVVDIDVYTLGSEAGKSLLKKIRNPAMQIQSYITLPSILERESTIRKTTDSRLHLSGQKRIFH